MRRGMGRVMRAVLDQAQWIESHGKDEAGYVARYGSKDDPKHYGDGGELIYAADVAALTRLQNLLHGRSR